MTTTILRVLTVEPDNEAKLMESLRANCDGVVSKLPGWISTSFLVSHDKSRVLIYSQWRDLASTLGWRAFQKASSQTAPGLESTPA